MQPFAFHIFMMYCPHDVGDNLWTYFCSSHTIWCMVERFVNFVGMRALQMRIYCYTGYTPFYSFPASLSALCNLILLCTQPPPPRQLTFPLIHSVIPQGVNNYTPVYSHCTNIPPA